MPTTLGNLFLPITPFKMTEVSEDAGGDTVYTSTYEAYDRPPHPFQKLAESSMVSYYNKNFNGVDYIKKCRRHPGNIGYGYRGT